MKTPLNFAKRWRRRGGATLTEYTFVIAIVSIAAGLMLLAIGRTTRDSLQDSADRMFAGP